MTYNKYLFLLLISLWPCMACNDKPDTAKSVVATTQEKTKIPLESMNTPVKSKKKAILFFGDSLTAGYGLDEDASFPSLIQDRIDSLRLDYTVINGGLSGETSAGGKGRIDWVLKNPIDIFVLELGANDVLRGLNLKETDQNLRAILDTVRSKHPDIPLLIAGMQAPPNMGAQYIRQFENIFISIAKDYQAGLIPFLLEGVAGIRELNLPDGKHPNKKGQHIVKENVWKILKPYL